MSWQPPSEDWQSALEQPEDWQAALERKGVPKEPLWSSTPAPAAAAPTPSPEAVARAPETVAPPPQTVAPAPAATVTVARTSPAAIGAFVVGIVGMWLWFLGPIAVVQGLRARHAINQSGGRLGGRALATIGLVLGVLETIGLVLSVAAIGLAFTIGPD